MYMCMKLVANYETVLHNICMKLIGYVASLHAIITTDALLLYIAIVSTETSTVPGAVATLPSTSASKNHNEILKRSE